MAARSADPRPLACRLAAVALLGSIGLGGCSAGPAPAPPPVPSAPAPNAPAGRVAPLPPPPPPIGGVPASVAQRVDQLVARVVAGRSVDEIEQAVGAIAEYGARSAPSIERGLPSAPPRARAVLLDVLALVGAPGCGVRASAWLADDDWRVREAAARVCARHRTPSARGALVALLADRVGRVREAAAAACGALRDPAVTAPLAALAAGAAGPPRQAALAALARTPGDPAVHALVAAVDPAAPDAVAVRALAARAAASVPNSRARLEAIVNTADGAVRRPALVGLARLGATGADSAMAVAKAITREAAAAMVPESGPPLEGPDGIATLTALGAPALAILERRVGTVDRPLMVEACLRLQRIPGDAATAGLRAAAARDDCPPFVVQELGRRRDAAALPLLIRRAGGTGDAAPSAIQALANIGGAQAVAALAELLTHSRPRTRGDAAGALAKAGGAGAAPLLEARLAPAVEPDAFARWLALQALAIVDGPRAAARARDLLERDPAVRVREGAASVLGRHGAVGAAGARLAAAATSDSEADVRYTALAHARAAGAAAEALVPCLDDSLDLVRALALREAGPAVPADRLRAIATPAGERDESIRALAVTIAAARALTGEPLAAVVAGALADPAEEVRLAAVHGLTLSHTRADGVRLAAGRLADESDAVRLAAMRVLAAAADARGAAAAGEGLASGDYGRRLESADALLAAAGPGAAAAARARFTADPAPERDERLHLLRVLIELEDDGAAALIAEETAALGLKERGERRGRRTARNDRAEVAEFRLYAYRALAAMEPAEASGPVVRASEAPELHLAVPALIALAAQALVDDRPRDAAARARTALELDPRSAEAWVLVWRVAARGALPTPELTPSGPHPNAIAAVFHRIGRDAEAVTVLRHPVAAALKDPKVLRNLSILLDLLGRFDEANAARAEWAKLARRGAGAGPADREAPGPDALRRRARRALARGKPAEAQAAARAALVRGAEPSGTPDEWIALVGQVAAAAKDTALADRAWPAAARAALTTSRLRLDLADGRLFAIAAAAARRAGDPSAARFASIARRRAAVR